MTGPFPQRLQPFYYKAAAAALSQPLLARDRRVVYEKSTDETRAIASQNLSNQMLDIEV
jgi:hypothetical protein